MNYTPIIDYSYKKEWFRVELESEKTIIDAIRARELFQHEHMNRRKNASFLVMNRETHDDVVKRLKVYKIQEVSNH